jgi:hypothetical protein
MPVRSLISGRVAAPVTVAATVLLGLLAATGTASGAIAPTATAPAATVASLATATSPGTAIATHALAVSAVPAVSLAASASQTALPADGHRGAAAVATPPGYSPSSLRSAYNLASAAAHGGAGETVAVVSAFGYPAAATDLATYRSHFRLPACTVANGCLRIRNEHGATHPLPAANATWAREQATQLDVLSALCPRCHLLLVEAASTSITDLGTAEDTAVSAGARFVANGWSQPESVDEDLYAHYFNHPGTAIVFAAGASDYGTAFPAALQYVISVGGTTLTKSVFNSRGWAEQAWATGGSGCALLAAKPSWQRADANPVTGCANRTENDVAADANPSTGAAVYDTGASGHWVKAGGLSLAAAIVTAAYALAGTPAADSYPASYPYRHASSLFDVISGPANGNCGFIRTYLCTAERGYDGPTGLGTPDGTAAFSASGTSPVTLVDPGTQDEEAGTSATIPVTGLDSRGPAATLSYSASGLPTGLSVKPVAKSLNALISGKLPAAVGSYQVTVTATDPKSGKSGSIRFTIVAAGSLTPATPLTARVTNGDTEMGGSGTDPCLDGGVGTAGTIVTVKACDNAPAQAWAYLPLGAPGAAAEFTLGGLCLGPVSGALTLEACDRSDATQDWLQLPGTLKDAGTGTCLTTSTGRTNPISLAKCDSSDNLQHWWLMWLELESGVPGMCLSATEPQQSQTSWPTVIDPCADSLKLLFTFNGSLQNVDGFCLSGTNFALTCGSTPDQPWISGPGGQLIDPVTGLCLDDPGDSATAGTQLTLSGCYGQMGEIWALS